MDILAEQNLVGAKIAPTAISRTSAPLVRRINSLLRIHFSHPESDGKSSDVGVGGRIGILRVCVRNLTSLTRGEFRSESCNSKSSQALPDARKVDLEGVCLEVFWKPGWASATSPSIV